jgi:hypothetical protein
MSCFESGTASYVSLDREAAGRYVLGRRTPAGGYSFYRTPEWGVEEPNAPDTLAAIESLRLTELVRLDDRRPSTQERQAAGMLLDAAWDPSGGWARPSADLETTAIALHASELTGLPGLRRSDRATIASFVRRCEDEVLGLRVAPTARTTSAGVLLSGLELARLFDLRLRHRQAIATNLALLQRPDGGLGARHRAISTLKDTWQGLRAAHLLDEHQEES